MDLSAAASKVVLANDWGGQVGAWSSLEPVLPWVGGDQDQRRMWGFSADW